MAMWHIISLFLSLLTFTAAIKINTVDGYPVEWLREPQPGTPPAADSFRPTPVPLRPLSMRTVYRTQNPSIVPTNADKLLILEGNAFSGQTVSVKLIPPVPTGTASTAGTCLDSIWNGLTNYPHEYANQALEKLNIGGQLRAYFLLPLALSGTIGGNLELPHEHLWPWICVCASETSSDCDPTNGTKWIHTNLRYAPVMRCDGDDGTTNTASTHNTTLVTDLCTGQIAQRAIPNPLGQDWGENDTVSSPPTWRTSPTNFGNHLFRERLRRTVCCGYSRTDGSTTTSIVHYGLCINPFLEKCCEITPSGQGKPFSLFREKCCFGGNWPTNSESSTPVSTQIPPNRPIISYLDDYCPCTSAQIDLYCNNQIPSAGTTNKCCTKTKYSELSDTSSWGKCYDGAIMKCCDTGDIYDPGTNQCCTINGVQSVNVPCPCSLDSHCGNNQSCCQDLTQRPIFPTPQEPSNLCSKYVNYPTGSGAYQVQPCLGQCIDNRFQMCCNGMACQSAFEECCNNTCCNKFSQRCTIGIRPAALGQFYNPRDRKVPFEICTTIESMTPIRAVLMYFFPLILLLATLLGLAFTLFFAKRQNSLQPLSAYEKTMFVLACAIILFTWPLYFSALWKYALVTIWTCFFTILAALSQIRPLNIGAIIALALLLIYLVDPFYGSEIFTLAFDRVPPRSNSVHGFSGVLSSLFMIYDNEQKDCQSFYDYFKRDRFDEDPRWDNPHKATFGFCSRDWFTALGIFECIALMLTFCLFFVTLITHIRNILFGKAEKTEEVVGWY